MNRSLTVSSRPRIAVWLQAADWAFAFLVLTIWASVAPVAYIFRAGTFGIAPYEVFEGCAVVACLVMWWRAPTTFVWPTGGWWLAAFMVLTSLSALQADSARAVVTVLGRFWLGWLVVFMLPSVVTDRRRLSVLVATMLLHAAVLIALTLGAALSAFGLPALPPVLMIQFQKNEYATYLAFAVAMSFIAVHLNWTPPWVRKLAIVVAVLSVVSWPLTYSRSGLLALVGTMGLLAVLTRIRRVVLEASILLALGATVWLALPSDVQATSARALRSLSVTRMSAAFGASEDEPQYTSDTFQQTIDERMVLDRAALRTIREHPVTGLGLTRWQAQSPVKASIFDVKLWRPITVGATIHNRWLLIGAESGLPTLATYLGFVGWVLWRAWHLRPQVDPKMRFFLNAMIACTVSLQAAMVAMPGTLWEYNQMAVFLAALQVAQLSGDTVRPRPAA